MIPEAASKRRGRPPVFDESALLLYGERGRCRTRRQRQERGYALRACGALTGADGRTLDPAFAFLVSDPNTFRVSVLAELGRIDGHDDIRTIAAMVCQRRLNTKAAAALVRAWRMGRL